MPPIPSSRRFELPTLYLVPPHDEADYRIVEQFGERELCHGHFTSEPTGPGHEPRAVWLVLGWQHIIRNRDDDRGAASIKPGLPVERLVSVGPFPKPLRAAVA